MLCVLQLDGMLLVLNEQGQFVHCSEVGFTLFFGCIYESSEETLGISKFGHSLNFLWFLWWRPIVLVKEPMIFVECAQTIL